MYHPLHTQTGFAKIFLACILVLLATAGVAFAETVKSNTVQVYVRPTVSCAPSVAQALINQPVTWRITQVNPSGTGAFYSYTWSGTDELSGGGSSREKSYATAGEKTASVKATPAGIDPPPEDLSRTVSCGSVTVTAPDLTANVPVLSGLESVSQGVYRVGRATLTGAVNNIGAVEAPAGFTSKYYFGLSADGTFYSFTDPQTAADREFPLSNASAPLAPNKATEPNRGINRAVASHTWDIGAGTWYFKTCADQPGTVTELNENNNCSGVLGPIEVRPTILIGSKYTLTVEKVSENGATGALVSADNKILCGTRCLNIFDEGSTVSLTAVPDANTASRLVRWEVVGQPGACAGSASVCPVIMDANKVVRATFTRGGGGRKRTEGPPDGICWASPTDARVGNTVTWTVQPYEEGTPPYSIEWRGDTELRAACENAKLCAPPNAAPLNYGTPYSIDVVYQKAGTKSGTVRITDNQPQSVEISCATEVTVTPKNSSGETPSFKLFADPPIVTLYFSKNQQNTKQAVTSNSTRLYIIPSGAYAGTAKVSTIKLMSTQLNVSAETEIKDALIGVKTLRVPLSPTSIDVKLNLRSARNQNQPFSNEFPPEHAGDARDAKLKGLDFTLEATPDIPVGNYLVTFTAVGSPESSADVTVRVEKEGEPPPPPPEITGKPPPKEPVLPKFEEF